MTPANRYKGRFNIDDWLRMIIHLQSVGEKFQQIKQPQVLPTMNHKVLCLHHVVFIHSRIILKTVLLH